jgi:hypothetical protein
VEAVSDPRNNSGCFFPVFLYFRVDNVVRVPGFQPALHQISGAYYITYPHPMTRPTFTFLLPDESEVVVMRFLLAQEIGDKMTQEIGDYRDQPR